MTPLQILILSDGRPGHYHLSEGVAAAIARRRPVEVRRLAIARRRLAPSRLLARMVDVGRTKLALRSGYGLSETAFGRPDLVISAGGDTLAANVAIARLAGCPNIYCGTLKHFADDDVSLVVTSYERFAQRRHHLVALKPSGMDRASLEAARVDRTPLAPGAAPRLAGLLIGGDSGLFTYDRAEWLRLADFLDEMHAAHDTRWIVSTSRRTADWLADELAARAARPGSAIAELIDFRIAGPGTLPRLFAAVDAILATQDSSTMISEAIHAGLPTVAVAPASAGFKDEEREYRAFLERRGWVRFLPIGALDPARFVAELGAVTPLAGDPLDELAAGIAAMLPGICPSRPAHPVAG